MKQRKVSPGQDRGALRTEAGGADLLDERSVPAEEADTAAPATPPFLSTVPEEGADDEWQALASTPNNVTFRPKTGKISSESGKARQGEEAQMVTAKLNKKLDLKRLSQGAALCGAPVGGGTVGSVDLLGIPVLGEGLALALASGAFLVAGAWMFRRWGQSPEVQGPAEPSPEAVANSQQERELINA